MTARHYKPEHLRRTAVVALPLRPAEKECLQEHAKAEGTKLTTLIKGLIEEAFSDFEQVSTNLDNEYEALKASKRKLAKADPAPDSDDEDDDPNDDPNDDPDGNERPRAPVLS